MTAKARLYSHYDAPMWESISEDAMKLQECGHCGAFRYPPGPVCEQCLSPHYDWTPIAGTGRVLSWATFHKQYLPAYPAPHTVVAAQLAEGPLMVAFVPADQVERLAVDAAVRIVYIDHADGYRLPVFELI
jgi:uncharacterized OB-fold protein